MYNSLTDLDACNFPGNFIANSVMASIVNNIIFVAVFTALCHPLFWQLLESYWPYLIGIIIAAAIGISVYVILIGCIYSAKINPRTRGLSHLFEIIIFFSAVVGGVAVSLGRVITGLIMLLLSLIRVDKPILPRWVLSIFYLDYTNKSYLSLVRLYCKYNNPIAVAFSESLLSSHQKSTKITKKMGLLWMYKNSKLVKKVRKQGHSFMNDEEQLKDILTLSNKK